MKKTLLVVFMILIFSASVCYAQEAQTASSIHPFTFADVAEFGMSYDELIGKFREYYDSYDCSHTVSSDSDVMTCKQNFDQQGHTSTYIFANGQLVGEVCTTVVRVEGFRKEEAFEQYAGAYNLSPYENCDNDILDDFINGMYTNTDYYTRRGSYTYMIMGGSDETDTDWPQAFIGFFSRDYIDSLTKPEEPASNDADGFKSTITQTIWIPFKILSGNTKTEEYNVKAVKFDLWKTNKVEVDRPFEK